MLRGATASALHQGGGGCGGRLPCLADLADLADLSGLVGLVGQFGGGRAQGMAGVEGADRGRRRSLAQEAAGAGFVVVVPGWCALVRKFSALGVVLGWWGDGAAPSWVVLQHRGPH